MRIQLEEERRALAAFVTKFDSLTSGLLGDGSDAGARAGISSSRLRIPLPVLGERQRNRVALPTSLAVVEESESPVQLDIKRAKVEPSLLEEQWEGMDEESFELEKAAIGGVSLKGSGLGLGGIRDKENLPL